ncbi:MAG: DnaJ domain-containing protein [Candidatus Accumulibacter sp.]|jgi:curved DNA-binding protein|nr:DnaJ domain-containing protein [Accumulibacter sp.]
MEFKDYYQTLGVAREATADEIKKAFRKLARKYHPDVSKEADAGQRMQEVNEAYAVLSDPERRAAYDQLGSGHRPGEDFRAPPGWDAGFEFSTRGGFSPGEATDFSDFFAQFFARMGASGGGGFRARRQGGGGGGFQARGEDRRAKVPLEIEDAFHGATRQLSLRVPKVDGEGRVTTEERTLKLRIPVGVREGQVIRLAGQGAPGHGDAPAGDLLLEVRFQPHARFRVDGRDLHVELPLAPWEAALGGVVPVELPGGSLKLRVPAGAQEGGTLRLRGKGIPGHPPGDVILVLRIVLPPADTPKARELYATMARELDFDPRRSSRS